MNSLAHRLTVDRIAVKRKTWTRVMTNKMTIAAWKLFHSDRRLHFGFVLYRLKRDFGMTEWEIANLTGIPAKQVGAFVDQTKKVLESQILQVMAKMKFEEEEDAWRAIPYRGKRDGQGFFIEKQAIWFTQQGHKRETLDAEPVFKLGGETEREYEAALKEIFKGHEDAEIQKEA